MFQLLKPMCFLALFLFAGAGASSAATFNWTVDCPADAVVGPVTVLAQNYSDSVDLTRGVSATVALLPTNNITREDNNAAAQGTYTGLLSCTLTLGGVTVPFTRSFSLDVPPAGPTGNGTMTTGAVSFTVDLGPQGQVDVFAPVDLTLGFSRQLVNGGIIIVPLIIDTTLLLYTLDHFLCYKAKTTPQTPKFEPVSVNLVDQFESRSVEVVKPLSLCAPAEKTVDGNTAAIQNPDIHLKGYKITQGTKHTPVKGLIVKNQFHPGGLSFDTIKPDRLLVPSLKDLNDPVTLPDPFDPPVEHFKCYKVKVTPHTEKFPKGIQATVVDQFNQPKLYNIKKPRRLCAPVLDKEHPVGVHTLAQDPDTHLMCYLAKKAKGEPKHVKVLGIHVNNQFGPEQLNTIKEEELCVPSSKEVP